MLGHNKDEIQMHACFKQTAVNHMMVDCCACLPPNSAELSAVELRGGFRVRSTRMFR